MVTVEDVEKMLVNDLKAELKSRGASTAGKKAELQERLIELIKAETVTPDQQAAESAPETVKTDTIAGALNTDTDKVSTTEVEQVLIVENKIIETKHEVLEPKDVGKLGNTESNQPTNSANVITNELPQVENSTKKEGEEGGLKERVRAKALLLKTVDSDSPSEPEKSSTIVTKNVRIDNFQRPLNTKLLIQWLNETCSCEITECMIWVNAIKTHCYITFHSEDDATRCIQRVTGQKFPSTMTNTLVCNYTQVKVEDAPHSAEAALKPGEWQQAKPTAAKTNETTPTANTSNKRKLEDDSQSGTVKVAKTAGGLNLFKRAAESALVNNEQSSSLRHGANNGREVIVTKQPVSNVSLDTLYRKTETKPPIYWLPVSDEIAERRKRLKERMGGNSSATAAASVST